MALDDGSSEIENKLQLRTVMIPDLVNPIKGFAEWKLRAPTELSEHFEVPEAARKPPGVEFRTRLLRAAAR